MAAKPQEKIGNGLSEPGFMGLIGLIGYIGMTPKVIRGEIFILSS
jgi:hypothetical protein